ncbi:MAG: Chemotaxis regulator - transmits chemoreceptor signals to flagelllar motor components CheY [Candidatus Ozemobacter sibiricus]|jgi:two-component system chemotaxis response regulator CheY|uniref:Chemotaxis regulator-transmits chemoreceptor signals to flagelllar motor components CheY n=1 Tax=Candidatus Ozemobacter sibiricus TaxID=2268124 RepID=A0A367ZMX6_9BACT|nr:MAG: Chemotaxis regulator - transmits chemoreceptor signals to flagelllar motor components CheY [Candidatus Ozemobacter sibiricus]
MGKRIMIVDDAAVMRIMLKQLFEKNGFEVVAEVSNGADAVERYEILRPDLVTMDITMPDMDGITAVKEIIRIDPGARIIMCSAMGQVDKVKAAVLAGAKSFLVKPLKPERVLQTVNQVLGLAEAPATKP